MRTPIYATIAILLAASSSAAQAATFQTPEPVRPAAFFTTSLPGTMAKLSNSCMDNDEAVVIQDATTLICEIRMSRSERIAARLLLAEPFAPSPRAFLQFTGVPYGPKLSRVQLSGWVQESRWPLERRTMSLDGAKFDRRMQTMLAGLGGAASPPDGSR